MIEAGVRGENEHPFVVSHPVKVEGKQQNPGELRTDI